MTQFVFMSVFIVLLAIAMTVLLVRKGLATTLRLLGLGLLSVFVVDAILLRDMRDSLQLFRLQNLFFLPVIFLPVLVRTLLRGPGMAPRVVGLTLYALVLLFSYSVYRQLDSLSWISFEWLVIALVAALLWQWRFRPRPANQ